ncbi:MAG: type IX secretion system sortase PorU [Flavobacteriales bacterium]|jgi:hypothetical protein|nr:type IX secretion system sortase PorU [Flavobacteriales bacterium]
MPPFRHAFLLSVILASPLLHGQAHKDVRLDWGTGPSDHEQPRDTTAGRAARGLPLSSPLPAGQVGLPSGQAGLPFTGAFIDMDRGELPFHQEFIAMAMSVTGVSAHLGQEVYAPVTRAEIDRWPVLEEWSATAPEVSAHLAHHRKRPHAMVRVVPFRRHPATGRLEKLVSFRLDLVEQRGTPKGGGGPAYPESSKLAQGQWYRFTVHDDGVYQLTYDFLQELGVETAGLASDQINIYGNHHGLLPFKNAELPPTDLMLNAIEVDDGGDGQFGPGDRILFYASGPQRWTIENDRFVHVKNVYCDSASYFVGIGTDPPKRILPAAPALDDATHTVTAFDDRQFRERDLYSPMMSGRNLLGELFDAELTHSWNFSTPFLLPDEPASLVVSVAARTIGSSNSSTFQVTSGSAIAHTFPVPGVVINSSARIANVSTQVIPFQASGSSVPVTVTFNKHDPITSVGWMDRLVLNCRRELRMTGQQFAFRDRASVGPGHISAFHLDPAGPVHGIWDVTDPVNARRVEWADEGPALVFRLHTDSLRELIAFRNSGYLTPVAIGPVPNQDLHATPLPADLVIVCPPVFMAQAERLAQRRTDDGYTERMVTPQQVYNGFSSGARDATAIKRYMKMLYDRAGADTLLIPKYLLLFGDGSYRNLSAAPSNHNFIPTYQTAESLYPPWSFASDDYFGLLDPDEGEANIDLLDLGVGRLAVHSLQQATQVVNKILDHDRLLMLGASGDACSNTGDGGLPDWRTKLVFVSDDRDGDTMDDITHMDQSDHLAERVNEEHPEFNVEKLYMDAFQQVSTPGGQRYPQGAAAIREAVQKGALIVNYIGHGGEVGWGHERFLDVNTIMNWSNRDRLPLFMTATCEFSRWDDPARLSAGELVLFNPNGGGIALMTTSRIAFSTGNFTIGRRFYDHVLEPFNADGSPQTLGDIFRKTKVASTTTGYNHRNFVLLGDPSQRLARPALQVAISAVTDTLGAPLDTLKALATVRIAGFVHDGSGQPLTSFNGQVVPTVFDKALLQSSLMNDADANSNPFDFLDRKNVLYRGKATVANGVFEFTFVVPKDINYSFGTGRISCYAESFDTNAAGYANDPIVGGTATDVPVDEQGPQVELFMNDDSFVRGGITDESPLLFARLSDPNGINTAGNTIGHDLLAVLDDNTDQAIVLNDLYEADLDTYKSGQVRYRFHQLAEGPHKLSLKAWDVHNNSSEATTEFIVASSAELALAHVLNYPNPFTTYTEFFFEHNRPCTTLDVQVQVFTVAGRLVKTISRQMACNGYRIEGLPWDGKDDFGDKLGRGVYVYRVGVNTPEGERAEKFEKLVILR